MLERDLHGHGGGNSDAGNHGAAVGLENIGAHAGDITHVVTDVVGDHPGVARVILRDAGLDLAHQVGTDVGALGEDTAANPGKQGHRRCPHAETVDGVRGFSVAAEEPVHGTQSHQAEGGDTQAHHRTAVEGDRQGQALAVMVGCDRGADIGLGGREHAQITGRWRRTRRRSEMLSRYSGPAGKRK